MFKIFTIVILVLGFLYWRGERTLLKQQGLDCQWNLIYAVCKSTTKDAKQPSFIDAVKAGASFKR